jgi:hypothetical protein
MKCNAKTKSVEYKKSIGKTGGGSYEGYVSTPIDEKIVEIIGDVPIFGQPHTAEPIIKFEDHEICINSSNFHILQ